MALKTYRLVIASFLLLAFSHPVASNIRDGHAIAHSEEEELERYAEGVKAMFPMGFVLKSYAPLIKDIHEVEYTLAKLMQTADTEIDDIIYHRNDTVEAKRELIKNAVAHAYNLSLKEIYLALHFFPLLSPEFKPHFLDRPVSHFADSIWSTLRVRVYAFLIERENFEHRDSFEVDARFFLSDLETYFHGQKDRLVDLALLEALIIRVEDKYFKFRKKWSDLSSESKGKIPEGFCPNTQRVMLPAEA